MPHRPVLKLLTGVTAVGKTELALRWAEQNGAEILSCDSLLFYRGMDIGTAKPTAEELARVPHHLLNLCPPSEQMDVVQFVELARQVVIRLTEAGKPILITGGSGFYLKAFLGPISDGIEVPASVREEIERRLETNGLPDLLSELHSLNPDGLETLDTANPRRVARALERCRASGLTLSELARRFAALPGPFDAWEKQLVQLDRPPEELNPRIEARVAAMLQAGLVAEVSRLRAEGFEANTSASRAIGYREVLEVLDGKADAATLLETISQNTRALVKKQRTWFRTQIPEHVVVHPGSVTPSDLFAHSKAI